MKSRIKIIIQRILFSIIKKERIISFLNLNQCPEEIINILNEYGYFSSVQKQISINKSNEPIPWYTYPAIEFISQLDLKEKTVFEWGSGNSSLFYANRAKEVISIEDNKEWFDKINSNRPKNLNIYHAKDDEYVKKISCFNKKFDVIIVDANQRLDCATFATEYLAPGGMIIIDNSDWFTKSAKVLRSNNLIQVDFFGFSPINKYTLVTSLFLSRDFSFTTINKEQPVFAIGGLTHVVE